MSWYLRWICGSCLYMVAFNSSRTPTEDPLNGHVAGVAERVCARLSECNPPELYITWCRHRVEENEHNET